MKLIILYALSWLAFSQTNPGRKESLLNGKIEITVPDVLQPMSGEDFNLKYPGKTKPPFIIADKNGEVNLICSPTEAVATESQLSAFKDFQLQQLKKARPDLELISDGVKTVNGKKVGYFKFISKAVDQHVFNYYFFVVVDKKVVLFTFNCIESLQPKWEKTADQVVASLKIK